ncbi:MAG: helix-turn-helix domain-containing protein [Mycobacterium sp.]
MTEVASPPTARVLDVVELLAESGGSRMRLSEIAEILGLSLGTAHNILSTLTERGWVQRDAADKTFTVGPALDIAAAKARSIRTLAGRAQTLAGELVSEMNCAASVVERIGNDLVITFFESPSSGQPGATPGETFPHSPPFGVAFAAWDTDDEQRAWIDRGAADNQALAEQLRHGLATTRTRGYEVDRTTPALARAMALVGSLDDSQLPSTIRHVRDQLAEFAALGFVPDPDTTRRLEVFSISAPVFDERGRPRLNVSLHPFRPMTTGEVSRMGRRLVAATKTLAPQANG